MIRRSVVLTEDHPSTTTSLVVTVMGPDRPGIVSLLADRAQRFGASWAASRLANLADEFAGMVHFKVPRENADALATALRGLESSGLRLVVAKSEGSGTSRSGLTIASACASARWAPNYRAGNDIGRTLRWQLQPSHIDSAKLRCVLKGLMEIDRTRRRRRDHNPSTLQRRRRTPHREVVVAAVWFVAT
ncbi:MAG TPA: ACT domain-containing protein [Burkholderiaceae bacterium]